MVRNMLLDFSLRTFVAWAMGEYLIEIGGTTQVPQWTNTTGMYLNLAGSNVSFFTLTTIAATFRTLDVTITSSFQGPRPCGRRIVPAASTQTTPSIVIKPEWHPTFGSTFFAASTHTSTSHIYMCIVTPNATEWAKWTEKSQQVIPPRQFAESSKSQLGLPSSSFARVLVETLRGQLPVCQVGQWYWCSCWHSQALWWWHVFACYRLTWIVMDASINTNVRHPRESLSGGCHKAWTYKTYFCLVPPHVIMYHHLILVWAK